MLLPPSVLYYVSCFDYRSAYKILQTQKGTWQDSYATSMWSKFWKIKVPSKVAHVCWRAFKDCLPTMTQLHAHYVPVPVTCPVCTAGDETILHALVSCEFAAQCWYTILGDYSQYPATNFKDWFDHLLLAHNKERWGDFVMLCWGIWKARNELVWQQRRSQVRYVVNSTENYFVQWKNAQKLSKTGHVI